MDQAIQQELYFYLKLAGFILLPFLMGSVGWAYYVSSKLKSIFGFMERVSKALETAADAISKSPSDQIIRDNTKAMEDVARAVKQLTHYMEWRIKETTGANPPPYVEGMTGS